jgi:23S rRNA pseudouridine1911/1915/1917 synthase
MAPQKIELVIQQSAQQSAAERADRLLARLTDLSRSRIQNLMAEGHVLADGKAVRPSDDLAPGTRIVITIPDAVPLDLTPEDRPVEILYEDEHLAVINKPQGISVHPSDAEPAGTLVNSLLHQLKTLSSVGGVARPGIVHRLDKWTSGALVVTKTDAAHLGLAKAFSTHSIERAYWALCYGAPDSDKPIKISGTIGRNPADRKKMAEDVRAGRQATT